jgi:hypothetical protein
MRYVDIISKRDAGGSHDDADRALTKLVLIGGHDRTKARLIILVARQHNLHAFRRLADDCAIISLAPNADCVGNCQAVRKTRDHPASDEAQPGGLADSAVMADIATEQQFGDLFRLLSW